MIVADSVFPEGALQLVHTDMFLSHVGLDDRSIVDQQARLPLNKFAKAAVRSRNVRHYVVHQQQGTSRDHAAHQRRVGTRHGILHGVGKEKQQSQIEGRHLSYFALAAQAHANQHHQVDHARAQSDLEQDVPSGEQGAVQLAVTGTGAFFGVLR